MAKQFYETNIFVIQPEKASSKKSNYWNVLNPGGVKLAIMHHAPDNFFIKMCRKAGLKAQYGADITVESPDGKSLMHFQKGFTFGMFRAKVTDEEGNLGYIVEEKLGLDGRQYMLYDGEKKLRGRLEGDWRAYSLQMKDTRNSSLGKVSRKSEEVNQVIFTDKSSFYVVHLYIDQPDKRWRKMLLGTSAAIALLLR